jgi:hypothetical protein
MARFRKLPVEVDAIQNTGEWAPLITWLQFEVGGVTWTAPPVTRMPDGTLNVRTLHGWTEAKIGDWVIRGERGDFWPCDPDVFAATYEEVA